MNSTDAKTFYPHGLRPWDWDWDWDWEEPSWDHARFARIPAGKKAVVGLHPTTPKAPDPFSWLTAHQTRRNLGSYFCCNCPGCGFTRPEIANLTYAKTFYPHGLRPWDGEWEEPAQDHARFAERDPVPGKSSRALPRTPLGPEGPRPLQLAHRTPDRTQPGQLPFVFTRGTCLVAMANHSPNHCSLALVNRATPSPIR